MDAVHFVATLASSEEGRGEKERWRGGLSAGKKGRFKAQLHSVNFYA